VEAPALPFFDIAYAAFQGGLWAMAEAGASMAERERTAARRRFYQDRLATLAR
jgi:hypothetical protein